MIYRLKVCFLAIFLSNTLCMVETNNDIAGSDEGLETPSPELSTVIDVELKRQTSLSTHAVGSLNESSFHLSSNITTTKVLELGNILKNKVKMLQKNGDKKVDVVFLIDSSSSVGLKNFNSELKFVKKLLADFSISVYETRVAVITFSDQDRVVRHVDHISIPSEEYHKCNMLHNDLPNIKYVGGLTYTLGALVEAQSVLEWSRPGARKAIFLVTDGFSNGGDPVPVAQILKENGTLIFTFGIQSGNVIELENISSSPTEEFSYLLDSFDQFEAVVRHALHQDLSQGSYQLVNETMHCDVLCSKGSIDDGGCCDLKAHCSCGTASGHYRCLCKPGYYGSGLKGTCTPCPIGTYHDGQSPGDKSVCRLCPDPNHITVIGEASSKNSCVCKRGFRAQGSTCEVITCPSIYPPEHGYFVKGHGMCPNVFNAACGMRCKAGYTLHGSSIRLCQENGTWSGKAPKCVVKMCPNPEVPFNGQVKCSFEPSLSNDLMDTSNENTKTLVNQYTVDTECEFSCQPGHVMIGSRRRLCLPLARWDGLRTVCKPVTCSSLAKLLHGSITPLDCVDSVKLPFGHKCNMTCDIGYKLVGPTFRECGGRGGQWSKKSSPSKCIDDQPPTITCPGSIEVETDSGEAFSSVAVPQPTATDNSGTRIMIWSQPAVSTPMKIPIGSLQITFIAMDPSHNQASCNMTVTVIDNEPPVIDSCISPNPINLIETDGNHSVSWLDPEFRDNSGKRPYVNTSHLFGEFPVGKTEVVATAFDESGNNSTCVLEIIVEDSPCSKQPPLLKHASLICNAVEEDPTNCSITCHEGYAFDTSTLVDSEFFIPSDNGSLSFLCSSFEKQERISPVLPECSETVLPNSVSQEGVVFFTSKPGACKDVALLEEVKMFVDLEISKQSGDFCKNSTHFACHVLSSNATCEEIASVEEEETNFIHHRKRSLLQYFSKKENSSWTSHSDVSHTTRFKRRETQSSSHSIININVHVKLQNIMDEKGNSDPQIEGNSGFSQLKPTLKIASIDLPSNLKGQALQPINFSWKEKTPSLVCPPGSAAYGSGLCLKCPSGFFFSTPSHKCQPCPLGEYQNLEGQMSCRSCLKGMFTRNEGSRSERDCRYLCKPGSFGRTHASYNYSLIGTSVSPCFLCSPGSYQPSYGASNCLPCPSGSHSYKKGAKKVEDCWKSTKGNISLTKTCLSNPCLNSGSCQSISFGFVSCHCPPGFYGPFCEIVFDYCNSSPCLHGGQCMRNYPSGYSCSCPLGFHGLNCEEEDDECSPNPCLNNGTCEDLSAGFYCDCPDGFQGLKCEINMDDCIENPCGDHGLCVDGISNYTCSCFDGYSGRHCEKYPLNFCLESMPCLNGGSCIYLSNETYSCLCPSGWKGDNCEEMTQDICISSPCLNGGTCVSDIDGKFFCHCRLYFSGNICQISLKSDFILHLNSPGVTDYAIIDLPEQNLTEVSVCLWLQSKDGFNYGTAFSYATKHQFNSFTLTDYNGFVFYVNGESVITDVAANDGMWHHVCVLWQSHHGLWKIYLDGSQKDNGAGLSTDSAVFGGGKFVLGQEQDSVGGSFSEAESLIGRIYRLEVWDYLLDPQNIYDLAQKCQPNLDGSIVRWQDFLPRLEGEVMIENSTFCSKCPPPDQLWRGNVVVNNVGQRIVATYVCEDGFVLQGSKHKKMERHCLKQGSWEGVAPVCVRISCGFPGYLPGGTFQGRSFRYSDTIKYICNFGAEIVGNATRVCQTDGKWSGQPPVCKGQECAPLHPPRNGTVTLSEKAGGIQVAVFFCNDGFHMEGANILTCMHDGTWDETIPECFQNLCPVPPEIEHGFHLNKSMNSFMFMDIIYYECEPGYEFGLNGSGIIYCSKDGKWCPYLSNFYQSNVQFPKCEPKYCMEPEPMEQGSWILKEGVVVDQLQYTDGSVLTVVCESDYIVDGPKTKYCQNKIWLPLGLTQCSKITCDTEDLPTYIPHSVLHLSGEEVGNTAKLTCKDGFQLFYATADPALTVDVGTEMVSDGSRDWVCNSTGSWVMEESNGTSTNNSAEWLACLPSNAEMNSSMDHVECNQPQAPAFGFILTEHVGVKNSVGTILELQCRPGFKLDGPSSVICGRNGTWIGLSTHCKPVVCPPPPQFLNMTIARTTAIGKELEFGNLVIFACHPGFNGFGDLSIRCQSNGTWSSLRGTCVAL